MAIVIWFVEALPYWLWLYCLWWRYRISYGYMVCGGIIVLAMAYDYMVCGGITVLAMVIWFVWHYRVGYGYKVHGGGITVLAMVIRLMMMALPYWLWL